MKCRERLSTVEVTRPLSLGRNPTPFARSKMYKYDQQDLSDFTAMLLTSGQQAANTSNIVARSLTPTFHWCDSLKCQVLG
jgi:hypothetical protein